MSFRFPYMALDLETTGLDRHQSHILQIAAIYDDGSPLEELSKFNVIVKNPVITYGEEYALNMNRHLLETALKADKVGFGQPIRLLPGAQLDFNEFLTKVQPSGKITVAGKNVGGFDIPVLNNPKNKFHSVTARFLHRTLDPGSMYTDQFDHIPSLGEINEITGRSPVTHDALDDCWDIVYAIRYKWDKD